MCPLGAWRTPFRGLNLTLMAGLLLRRKPDSAEEEARIQPFLLEFYRKKWEAKQAPLSQSNFCAWSCHSWTKQGRFLTELCWSWSWDGNIPAVTQFLTLAVYPIHSNAHQPLFQHGASCLPWVEIISWWHESGFPLFSTRLPAPWQLCAACLSSRFSCISNARRAGAASSEFVRPAKMYRQDWKCYCCRTRERVSGIFLYSFSLRDGEQFCFAWHVIKKGFPALPQVWCRHKTDVAICFSVIFPSKSLGLPSMTPA